MINPNWPIIPYDPDIVRKAIDFAAIAHHVQTMPGTDIGYMQHLMSVTMEVVAAIMHEPVNDPTLAVVCAILHDVIEDPKVLRKVLAEKFGEKNTCGIEALSKNESLSKTASMIDSLNRILLQPDEIALVKMCDRSANLGQKPPHWTDEKSANYNIEAKVIHAHLKHTHNYMANRLEERILHHDK